MCVKVGLIGPTNLLKLSKLTKKPVKFFLKKAEEIGKILAEAGCELWINSDKGMAERVARSYKKNNGKKLVILFPVKGEPWPHKHAKAYIKNADFLKKEPNWFWTNYDVVTLPDFCLCLGLSSGTFSELAYIKWNCQFGRGKLKRLIVMKELLREKKIPAEIETDVKKILIYLEKTEELKPLLKKLKAI